VCVCVCVCVYIYIPIYNEYKATFLFQILLRTKEGLSYFRVLQNKYEDGDYEKF
jgi:hypothetical protein